MHYVDAGMDTGPHIIQAKVPVLEGDDYPSLHARIQVEEHRIYPLAVQMVADNFSCQTALCSTK